jgi:hypothetical protein
MSEDVKLTLIICLTTVICVALMSSCASNVSMF